MVNKEKEGVKWIGEEQCLACFCFIHRRSGQQRERTTGGADSRSGGQLGLWREACLRTAGGA